MRIGIITDAIDDRAAGIATYVRNLVDELYKIDKENEYFLIHHQVNRDKLYKKRNEIIVPIRNIPFAREFRKLVELPFRLRNHNLDVVHETAQIGPFLFPTKYKKITTIHDLVPLILPHTQPKFSTIHHKIGLPIISRLNNKIIAVSNSTKKDIHKYLDIPNDKIITIHEATNKIFKPIKSKQALKKYNLTESYILFVGTLEPRKNIIGLIKAFHSILKKHSSERLVIVGRRGWKYKEIFNLAQTKELKEKITFLENVETKDLPALYSHAKMFVYPSLYEGFGLPPLEAMNCKCPVITSNNSSLPEVVKDAAILINPKNIKQLQKAIESLIKSKHLRNKLIKAGLEQSKNFSWKKTARNTSQIYKSFN